jgi:hypothetical protein
MQGLSSTRNAQELFLKFNYDIRKLAVKYPVESSDHPEGKLSAGGLVLY